MSSRSRLLRGGVSLFISNGGRAIISFAGLVFFAKQLPQNELGAFFLFQTLVSILSIPSDLGILGALEKRVSEFESSGQFLTTAALMELVPLAVISTFIYYFRDTINQYVGLDIAILVVIGTVLKNASQLMIKLLRGELRVSETATLQFTEKATWAVVGAGLVLNGFGILGVVYALLASYFVVFIWGMYKRSTPFGTPSRSHARSLFDFAKYNFISAVGANLYNWVDVFVLGLFVSNSLVAAYEVAWRVSSTLMIFGKAVSTALFPEASMWDTKGNRQKLQSTIPKLFTSILLFSIPGFLGIALLSQEILTIVFRPEYGVAGLVLIILSGQRVINSLYIVLGKSLDAINHPGLSARATAYGLTTNIILNFVLIWQAGILGAAMATTISFIADAILHKVYIQRYIPVDVSWSRTGWILLSSLVMSVILLLTKRIYAVDTAAHLMILIMISAAIYAVVLFLNPSIRTSIKTNIRTMLS